jgi:hypothetical protein
MGRRRKGANVTAHEVVEAADDPRRFTRMKLIRTASVVLSLCMTGSVIHAAQAGRPAPPAAASAKGFNEAADNALAAMRKRAGELGIGGVAVVAWFEGESIRSWTSKMVVVDRYKDEPTPTNKGSNLLAIAYAKASEMADTLKNSGSGARPPMTGEFGWPGGAIARGATGYWIAAFSGGKSEDDVQVSKAGLAALQ